MSEAKICDVDKTKYILFFPNQNIHYQFFAYTLIIMQLLLTIEIFLPRKNYIRNFSKVSMAKFEIDIRSINFDPAYNYNTYCLAWVALLNWLTATFNNYKNAENEDLRIFAWFDYLFQSLDVSTRYKTRDETTVDRRFVRIVVV